MKHRVYFARSDEKGIVKIGFTSFEVHIRLQVATSYYKTQLREIATIKPTSHERADGFELESAIHFHFREFRHKGVGRELYRLSDEQIFEFTRRWTAKKEARILEAHRKYKQEKLDARKPVISMRYFYRLQREWRINRKGMCNGRIAVRHLVKVSA